MVTPRLPSCRDAHGPRRSGFSKSARAEIFEDKANLYTVKVTWFGEPGEITVVITSAEGTVDFRNRKAELRGDVRLERADGAVLSTEEIFWDEKNKDVAGALAGRHHHAELHLPGREPRRES